MKNITKVGLSALAGALAFTSVQAGEMSLSGSMEATFTKKGGCNFCSTTWYGQRTFSYWFR